MHNIIWLIGPSQFYFVKRRTNLLHLNWVNNFYHLVIIWFLIQLWSDSQTELNQWIAYFTSTENRHALPLFTSLLNVVCSYDPVGYGLPYNYLMFSDFREPLVEVTVFLMLLLLCCYCLLLLLLSLFGAVGIICNVITPFILKLLLSLLCIFACLASPK